MSTEIVWITPLLILPGVCLLILSTSARYSALHTEIHHWLEDSHDLEVLKHAHLITRARLFRNALVALYISVFVFVCASIIGAIFGLLAVPGGDVMVFGVAFIGILALGFASFELIRESLLSLDVIKAHVSVLMTDHTQDGE